MRVRPALAAVAGCLFLALPAIAGPLTQGDRQRLLAHLEMTEAWLVSEVTGLSEAQLRFRMTPESWTVMDVVEHLAIAEPQYWKNLTDSMATPVKEGYEPQAGDDDILWYGIDRTDRNKTGEARVPHGTYPSVKESLAAFRTLRKTMLETAKTSQEDYRGRALIGGNMDVYQWFLMISTHSQRHILQIREIKAHTAYPKA
jgi:hypothetical protein